ncbi:MAG: hypothetical protein ACXQTG_05950, partial [Methanoculleaceae archaeon]
MNEENELPEGGGYDSLMFGGYQHLSIDHRYSLSLPVWVPSPSEIIRYRDRKSSQFRWEREFDSWSYYPL